MASAANNRGSFGRRRAREGARRLDGMILADPETGKEFDADEQRAVELLHGLGFCGHYLHFHKGGRSGKAPILCILHRSGGTMAQQELGLFFELKPGSLSEILSKMEGAGLIERTRDEHDRRQLNVHLTAEGEAQAQREIASRERFHEECFSCLTAEEQEQLAGMLARIRKHWEGLDDY